MPEYISREALLKYWLGRDGRRFPLHDCDNFPTTVHLADVQQSIRNAPVADVAEVVHGRWIEETRDIYEYDAYWEEDKEVTQTYYQCSVCGRQELAKEPYCNCGCKMDKEDET